MCQMETLRQTYIRLVKKTFWLMMRKKRILGLESQNKYYLKNCTKQKTRRAWLS